MPPARGASWMWKIYGGLPCYVVLVGDAFGVKVERGCFTLVSLRFRRELGKIRNQE